MISETQKNIDDVKKGLPLSFESIYSLYTPLISSLAEKYRLSFSLSEDETDDLRQEAAMALYDAALSYGGDRGVTFGLYAKICIRNRLVSYIRRNFGGTVKVESIEESDEAYLVLDSISPEQVLIDRESVSDIKKKISASLTELEGSVFDLYSVGASCGDISKALGIDKKSVDNAMQRIKAKLKKLL